MSLFSPLIFADSLIVGMSLGMSTWYISVDGNSILINKKNISECEAQHFCLSLLWIIYSYHWGVNEFVPIIY